MTDMFLFIQQGWRNIWKQNIIWLFSSIALIQQLLSTIPVSENSSLLWQFLVLVEKGALAILSSISSIGVSYLAYRYALGKPATIQETLSAVKEVFVRVIVLGIFIAFISSPLFCWAIYVSMDEVTRTVQLAGTTILALLPFSIFNSIYDFSVFGFFSDNFLVPQSLKRAWGIFVKHFAVLATLGIIFAIITRIYLVVSGIVTVSLESYFNTQSFSNFDFLNPSSLLSKNVLFLLISGSIQVVLNPFSASVFALAYLKFSNEKLLK